LKIEQFPGDDGIKIPIYSFYLKNWQDEKDLKKFYGNIRINNEADDEWGLINVHEKTKIVEVLCRYTMRMIARKNPTGGNAQGLIEKSRNLTFL
jgi:hypothetical protein